MKKGPWSPEEDAKLKDYMEKNPTGGNWISLPQKAGLRRCGKSCRLRWLNYLRPNLKHGDFSEYEERVICTLFATIGSRWSVIAAQLPGRTDNDIKNYWNTKLKKKLMVMGIVPSSHHKRALHQPYSSSSSSSPSPPMSSSSYNPSFYTPLDANYSNFLSHGNQNHQQMGMENNCFFSGVEEEDQKFMISSSNGLLWGDQGASDYGLEEIKQLISSSTSSCDSFLLDEIKAEEKVMYY